MSVESDVVQSAALREAIREYEANKWKAIGQKLGKPAKVRLKATTGATANYKKACEQYAKEHFKDV